MELIEIDNFIKKNSYEPIKIKCVYEKLPPVLELTHKEILESINNDKRFNNMIRINLNKNVFCEAINKINKKCGREACYIYLNKNKVIYNNKSSHIPLCWFCGINLLQKK